jgi:hypothetical protein
MSYRSYRHPIYKSTSAGGGCATGISTADLKELYNNMSNLLTATGVAIGVNEAAIADGSSLTAGERIFYAPIAGSLLSQPSVYVRLQWLATNPGVIFDRNSCVHVLQLKAIYDAIFAPNSWVNDPLAAKIQSCLEA